MQSYADTVLRLTVRLEQLSRNASSEMQKVLRKMQKELVGALASDKIDRKKVLDNVKQQVRNITLRRYEEIEEIIFNHQSTTADVAHKAEVQSYASLGAPASTFVEMRDVDKVVATAMDSVMPGLGAGTNVTVGDMLDGYSNTGKNNFTNIATRAYQEGLSVSTITRMVRDATALSMRHSETIARTSIQAVANQARSEVADDLPVDKEMWLATLDTKTCVYCQGLDGTCRPKGQFPVLAHPNCRCVKLYVADDVSCSQAKKGLSRVERGADGKSKPTGKYETYGEWIMTQPVVFQEEVLGKKRSQLLRQGKLTFSKMYTKTGSRKTIVDLESYYSTKANVIPAHSPLTDKEKLKLEKQKTKKLQKELDAAKEEIKRLKKVNRRNE